MVKPSSRNKYRSSLIYFQVQLVHIIIKSVLVIVFEQFERHILNNHGIVVVDWTCWKRNALRWSLKLGLSFDSNRRDIIIISWKRWWNAGVENIEVLLLQTYNLVQVSIRYFWLNWRMFLRLRNIFLILCIQGVDVVYQAKRKFSNANKSMSLKLKVDCHILNMKMII